MAQDQFARRRVGKMHALEIDDHITRLRGELGQPSHQLLGGPEEQRALRLQHGDAAALLRQDLALIGRAQAV
jgi:hypothetical protein